jgi:RimJ/RimL family protein N-acetyltransferase
MASLRPDAPFVGRLVRVEPVAERHRDGLRAALGESPEIMRFMPYPGFDRWFEHALRVETEVPFAVLVGGRVVGSTRYLAIAPEHRRVEIGGTWMVRSQWGTGANVETKLLLLEHAFERWGAMRVEFKTDARNLRTRGSLLALGARFEGIFRKHMLVTDGVRDSAWYAIVDDEWPAVKELLLRRLGEREAGPAAASPARSL